MDVRMMIKHNMFWNWRENLADYDGIDHADDAANGDDGVGVLDVDLTDHGLCGQRFVFPQCPQLDHLHGIWFHLFSQHQRKSR